MYASCVPGTVLAVTSTEIEILWPAIKCYPAIKRNKLLIKATI
jgi:hypothetical protein